MKVNYDTQLGEINSLFIKLIELEFFGDAERCAVRAEIVHRFPSAALTAAKEYSHYDENDNLDPSEAYPDEVYAYLTTDLERIDLINQFRSAILNALRGNT